MEEVGELSELSMEQLELALTHYEQAALEDMLKQYEKAAIEYLHMYMEYRHFEDRELLKDQIAQCERVIAAIKLEVYSRRNNVH